MMKRFFTHNCLFLSVLAGVRSIKSLDYCLCSCSTNPHTPISFFKFRFTCKIHPTTKFQNANTLNASGFDFLFF